jgi:hypothetical protein
MGPSIIVLRHTNDQLERDLGALGLATDEGDGDGAVGVISGSIPGDLVGRAGGDDLVLKRSVDGVEALGLGEDRGGHGHEGRNGHGELHLGYWFGDVDLKARDGVLNQGMLALYKERGVGCVFLISS